jgi:hypothetical protein
LALGSEHGVNHEGEKRTYSASEAASYARRHIAYCERIMAEYPDADMTGLRTQATAFLQIVEAQPDNLEAVRALHEALVAGKTDAGTGWFFLMSYVGEYIEHWGHARR